LQKEQFPNSEGLGHGLSGRVLSSKCQTLNSSLVQRERERERRRKVIKYMLFIKKKGKIILFYFGCYLKVIK
jgi:hypothetical protein